MPRPAGLVAVSLFLAAPASLAARQLPGISARAPARGLEISLGALREEPVCTGAVAPTPWRDASDARFFAAAPTARLDEQELAAGSMAPLIDVRAALGVLRLFILGSPVRPGLRFTTAGWRPRWPFC